MALKAGSSVVKASIRWGDFVTQTLSTSARSSAGGSGTMRGDLQPARARAAGEPLLAMWASWWSAISSTDEVAAGP